MAPPKKRKTAPAHSDFTKSKSSLKTKQRAPPSNATNTAFKARSIVLPNQGSITQLEERRATRLTDDRGRGVDELITILRGVGQGGSKAEALDSLSSLLLDLPDGVTTGLGLLPILLPQITSSSAAVRSSLVNLLSKFISTVPRDALVPYGTSITLWITSGMNHIWKEVREDAAKLAEVVIDLLGQDLVRGWTWSGSGSSKGEENDGRRVFTTLLTALGVSFEREGNQGSTSSTTVNVQSDLSSSPLTKLRLLSCLEKLIHAQAGLVDETSPGDEEDGSDQLDRFPTWIFRSAFETSSDWEAFVALGSSHQGHSLDISGGSSSEIVGPFASNPSLLESQRANVPDFADVEDSAGLAFDEGGLTSSLAGASSLILSSLDDFEDPSAGHQGSSHSVNPYLQLYQSLHPLLLHTFLDQAPSVLGPEAATLSRGEAIPLGLRLIAVSLSLARTLFRAALQSGAELSGSRTSLRGAEKDAVIKLTALLDHSSIYFPFERILRGTEGATKISLLKTLSASWCELAGIVKMLDGDSHSHASSSSKRKGKGSITGHLSSVEQYLVDILASSSSTGVTLAGNGDDTTASLSRLSEEEYLSLMPTIWQLLHDPSQPATTAPGQQQSSSCDLLTALLSHWSSTKGTNPIKIYGFELLSRICYLPYFSSLRPDLRRLLTRPTSDVRKLLRTGFLGGNLGKWIYELASRPTSLNLRRLISIFSFLLSAVRYDGSSAVLDADVLISTTLPTLKPFFWITHATRGDFAGPWNKVRANDELRRTVEAFVRYLTLERQERSEMEDFLQSVNKAGMSIEV